MSSIAYTGAGIRAHYGEALAIVALQGCADIGLAAGQAGVVVTDRGFVDADLLAAARLLQLPTWPTVWF